MFSRKNGKVATMHPPQECSESSFNPNDALLLLLQVGSSLELV